jgi:two-component system response regulator FlrC
MKLLIIGSLDGQIGAASQIAMARGAKVFHAEDIAQGLASMRAGRSAELVMIDAGEDIASLVQSLEAERISVPVVACSTRIDADSAVKAIKAGAKEFIPLPPEADLIAAVFEAVAEESDAIIYNDPVMSRVVKLADQIAPSDASVLITGESGTGKEVMARYLHKKSKRAHRPLISVNCAAIPDNLLESELFGHEKGAFTGAVARRIGKFEEADGGTLLLDEISEMDIRLQAKLLRALQEGEIDRVGGNKPIPVDIRILATSNRDLTREVDEGRFREDLFFRLNVVQLKLPPLRERPHDIEKLCDHFVHKYSQANDIPYRPISSEALAMLQSHHWRGNVRELENSVHRAVLLASGNELDSAAFSLGGGLPTASPAHAPAGSAATAVSAQIAGGSAQEGIDPAGTATGDLVGKTVAEVERDLIIDTLSHCLGNRTHAANILGISIRTLRNKLKQYSSDGVHVPQPRDAGQQAIA